MRKIENARIGVTYATFHIDSRIRPNRDENKPVVFVDSEAVGFGRAGDRIAGVLCYIDNPDKVREPLATVAIRGLFWVPMDMSYVVIGSPVCIGVKCNEVACTSRQYPERLIGVDWENNEGLIQL